MPYKFTYRRFLFWKTFEVVGHRYEESQNKMIIFFEDGSVREISLWNLCEVKLGQDWVLAMKKNMENDAGQAIPLKIKTPA